jgi:hypothetical protein
MTKVPDEVGLLLENRYFVTAAWRLVDTLRALEVGAAVHVTRKSGRKREYNAGQDSLASFLGI